MAVKVQRPDMLETIKPGGTAGGAFCVLPRLLIPRKLSPVRQVGHRHHWGEGQGSNAERSAACCSLDLHLLRSIAARVGARRGRSGRYSLCPHQPGSATVDEASFSQAAVTGVMGWRSPQRG